MKVELREEFRRSMESFESSATDFKTRGGALLQHKKKRTNNRFLFDKVCGKLVTKVPFFSALSRLEQQTSQLSRNKDLIMDMLFLSTRCDYRETIEQQWLTCSATTQ